MAAQGGPERKRGRLPLKLGGAAAHADTAASWTGLTVHRSRAVHGASRLTVIVGEAAPAGGEAGGGAEAQRACAEQRGVQRRQPGTAPRSSRCKRAPHMPWGPKQGSRRAANRGAWPGAPTRASRQSAFAETGLEGALGQITHPETPGKATAARRSAAVSAVERRIICSDQAALGLGQAGSSRRWEMHSSKIEALPAFVC